jgi:hypothetical protein
MWKEMGVIMVGGRAVAVRGNETERMEEAKRDEIAEAALKAQAEQMRVQEGAERAARAQAEDEARRERAARSMQRPSAVDPWQEDYRWAWPTPYGNKGGPAPVQRCARGLAVGPMRLAFGPPRWRGRRAPP